jgi:hypothetical protein
MTAVLKHPVPRNKKSSWLLWSAFNHKSFCSSLLYLWGLIKQYRHHVSTLNPTGLPFDMYLLRPGNYAFHCLRQSRVGGFVTWRLIEQRGCVRLCEKTTIETNRLMQIWRCYNEPGKSIWVVFIESDESWVEDALVLEVEVTARGDRLTLREMVEAVRISCGLCYGIFNRRFGNEPR